MHLPPVFILVAQAFAVSSPALFPGIKPKPIPQPRQQPLRPETHTIQDIHNTITPKLFIINMFRSEEATWHHRPTLNLLAQNITIPGSSPLFPQAHCTANHSICQFTLGEGEINAATSTTALWLSPDFDLRTTYFLISGIGGVNPHLATTGSPTLARFAIQFDLQHELDRSQVPENWTSGYLPRNSSGPATYPGPYPGTIYGTEVFQMNENLKKRAALLARRARLDDTVAAQTYRRTYGYSPAQDPPAVVECDSGTSNVFWSGSVLGDAFSTYTKLVTNGTGEYCVSQQEDNATLEALLRGHGAGRLDFRRVMVMRTGSDFDRAPPRGETETFHLLEAEQGGFGVALENLYRAGMEIVRDVVGNWDGIYEEGIEARNYVGGLFNGVGGWEDGDVEPDGIYSS